MPHYATHKMARRVRRPSTRPGQLIRHWADSDFAHNHTMAETSRRLAFLAQLARFEGEEELAEELADGAAEPYLVDAEVVAEPYLEDLDD